MSVLTLFSADWCQPCRQLKRELTKAGIDFDLVDIDVNADLATDCGVGSIPRLAVRVAGELRTLPQYGSDLPPAAWAFMAHAQRLATCDARTRVCSLDLQAGKTALTEVANELLDETLTAREARAVERELRALALAIGAGVDSAPVTKSRRAAPAARAPRKPTNRAPAKLSADDGRFAGFLACLSKTDLVDMAREVDSATRGTKADVIRGLLDSRSSPRELLELLTNDGLRACARDYADDLKRNIPGVGKANRSLLNKIVSDLVFGEQQAVREDEEQDGLEGDDERDDSEDDEHADGILFESVASWLLESNPDDVMRAVKSLGLMGSEESDHTDQTSLVADALKQDSERLLADLPQDAVFDVLTNLIHGVFFSDTDRDIEFETDDLELDEAVAIVSAALLQKLVQLEADIVDDEIVVRSKHLLHSLRSASLDLREDPSAAAVEVIKVEPAAGRALDSNLAVHQCESVARLDTFFTGAKNRRGMLCLPTGGGKTRTSMHWLLTRQVAKSKRILWLTHRVELLDQVRNEIARASWLLDGCKDTLRVSRAYGGHKDFTGDVVLASTHTLIALDDVSLAGLGHAKHPFGMVVYDEAHRAAAPKTLAALDGWTREDPRLPMLGLTATPFRRTEEGTVVLHGFFGAEPIHVVHTHDLIQAGFLARAVHHRQAMRSTESFRLSPAELSESHRGQDYPLSVLRRLARHEQRNHEIVNHWVANRSQFGKTIAFACDIAHAEGLAELFQHRGVAAAAIHSELPKDRRSELMRAFRAGELELLTNVDVLTEGTDVPDTRCILLARPTTSPVLYRQMIGRGMRGPNACPGKTRFAVIDCVDNFYRHGLSNVCAEVMAELGAVQPGEFEAAESCQLDDQATIDTDPEREARRKAALAAALASLLSRGYDPIAYTYWGELEWGDEGPSAETAPVFTESIEAIREGVALVTEAISSGEWSAAHAHGGFLDQSGAFRRRDWDAMLQRASQTGRPPLLTHVRPTRISETNVAIAALMAGLAGKLTTATIPQVHAQCAAAHAEHATLRSAFVSAATLAERVMTLILELTVVSRDEPDSVSSTSAVAEGPALSHHETNATLAQTRSTDQLQLADNEQKRCGGCGALQGLTAKFCGACGERMTP